MVFASSGIRFVVLNPGFDSSVLGCIFVKIVRRGSSNAIVRRSRAALCFVIPFDSARVDFTMYPRGDDITAFQFHSRPDVSVPGRGRTEYAMSIVTGDKSSCDMM